MANSTIPYAVTMPHCRIEGIATANNNGFKLSFSTNISLSILYHDNNGRVAVISKIPNSNTNITMLNGVFNAQSADDTQVFLNTGNYVRAAFFISSINPFDISLSVY